MVFPKASKIKEKVNLNALHPRLSFQSGTMKHEDIILPNAPLFLVHKGWSSRQQQRATAEATRGGAAILELEREEENGKVSVGERLRGSDAARRFVFVNTIRPDRFIDPKVRKFVMSHVKTGVKRGHNMPRTPKSKPTAHYSSPQTDSSTERRLCRLSNEVRISLKSQSPVSGASSPFYGNIPFSLPTGPRFQLLLSYCTF